MFWQKLKHLFPAYRRAQEQETLEELESLEALAEPGELHNLTRAAEEARAVWTFNLLEQLYRDAQYAVRTMRHNPGFTATAVLSLALGIGANTAIFTLMDALLWRWLPVPNPRELVQLTMRSARSSGPAGDTFSNAIIDAFDQRKDIFTGVAGFSAAMFDVGPREAITRVSGAWVTGGYYDTLEITPALGRLLTAGDDAPGAAPAAVLSYGYWQSRYSANPDAIGQSIILNGVPVPIVGVSPFGFEGANVGTVASITVATAALPALEPGAAGLLNPGNFWLRALTRPQRGLTAEQAQAGMRVVWPSIAEHAISAGWPANRRKEMADSIFELTPGGTGYTNLRQRFQKPLMVLWAATGLVLLIACANVASLLLARATARHQEISVRLSIGAGRGRIIRQLLTESTLLSLMGGGFGVLLAWLTSDLLLRIFSGASASTIALDVTPDWRILGFACAVAVANGIVFGLAPAIQTTAVGGASRIVAQGRARHSRMLTSLVAAQSAIALLLLVGAGLFARTMQNLLNVDPGFRREGVLVVGLDGQRQGYKGESLTEFYRGLLKKVQALPGVASASLTTHTPMNGWTWTEAVIPKGRPLPQNENAVFIAAGPGFFATMRTPLLLGREFDEHDTGSPNVAIVNEAFASRFFADRNPVGQYLTATVTNPPSDLQIVGVVRDVLTNTLRGKPRPIVYVPYFQRTPGNASIVIRVNGSLSQTASAIRKELQPSFPTSSLEVHALSEQLERTLLQERLLTSVTTGFGVLGLILACVGLYGLLGYTVVRRTREIGIRMALGARRSAVLWLILSRALWLVAIGVVAGVPIAWMVSRLLESMLFGLKPGDPLVIAGSVIVLVAAGLVAAYVPARQATRVDPMTALRVEQ